MKDVNFSNFSNTDIHNLILKAENELTRRNNIHKNRLVETFKKAFEDMTNEDIHIYYEGTRLSVIDNFTFI